MVRPRTRRALEGHSPPRLHRRSSRAGEHRVRTDPDWKGCAVELLVAVAIVLSGLAAGGLMVGAVMGAPLTLALSKEQFPPLHRFMVGRMDRYMPGGIVLSALANLALAGLADEDAARTLFLTAGLLFLAVIAVSLTTIVPINTWVKGLDPARLPEDWERVDPRRRWRDWNLVRTALGLLAVLCHAAAVASGT